ncbi:MAG: phosphate ABC transporter substrate-binding protein [Candidatus Coatesbacteria bacterium]|nr:MAG: phosphate ABC transporter substrate-binding protein [Candidatus Coatesbacteria bacterium]
MRAKRRVFTGFGTLATLVALALLLIATQLWHPAFCREVQRVVLKGSDTIVNLASAWAEEYMKRHPGASISVTGGGSGTGVAAMLNGTCDIANCSRRWKQSEKDRAARLGITPVEHIIAYDGISVVVNKHNPVSELTLSQIRKIFNGSYTNWRQVGGPSKRIIVLTRDTSSGTYLYFQKHVLMKDDYTDKARMLPSNAAIANSVTQDRWAIGYVGLGYALSSDVKMIKVKKTDSARPIAPSAASVSSGAYPIARPLFMYTNGEPTGATRAFLRFVKSHEGQKIVEKMKFVPLKTK